MPLITIHNAETGEIITREMNEKELAQLEADIEQGKKTKAREKAEQEAKMAALAKLQALGLTTDDLSALGL